MRVACPKNRRGGFTLTEILVSSAILIVLLAILLGMGDRVARFWQASEGRRETDREIRAALGVISGDLRNALLETSNPATLLLRKMPGSDSNESLFFATEEERGGNETVSGIRLIGYFLAENPSRRGETNLYRFNMPWPGDGKPFSPQTLESLYAKASASDTATTEILARRIARFGVLTLPEHSALPELLEISLDPGARKTGVPATATGITEFLPLPPWRDLPGKP